ncbi:unnamed protein product [Porites evermanni]|uniref:Torsin-1A-interacting protein 1/2 AAA+ activator domain-containing protein n=1 Tax=Porites evermanni TaxID=104178 RepID=A0ABN8T2Z0_9CNID|nr:unnamed protein product [Porites evermanni]
MPAKNGGKNAQEDIASPKNKAPDVIVPLAKDSNKLRSKAASSDGINLGEKTKKENKTAGEESSQDISSDGKSYGPPPQAQNTTNPKREPEQASERRQVPSSMDVPMILLIVAFMLIIVAIIFWSPEPEIETDFDFPKIFANKIVELQSSFTNQTDRFWRILKNRGLAHLRNASPPQPLVLLLAAPPAAHSTVECFARKLAEALDPKHKRMLATIDGREERNYPGEKAKKRMDDLLIRRFKNGHKAALIHHFELLPPPSPLLFYSYCDDQNAPNKHVAIIFTVHLPVEPDASLEPKEAEGTVEKYLADEVWGKEDKDTVRALLSRVANTVALMNGESSSLATC